jgi:PAS domain-containing protein
VRLAIEVAASSRAVQPSQIATRGQLKILLTSWKEIAKYLGRSVRTIQRWEREYGLPVHRPSHKQSRVVIADKDEIDGWIGQQFGTNKNEPAGSLLAGSSTADNQILHQIGRRGPSSAVLAGLVDFVEQNLSCKFAEISLFDKKMKRRYLASLGTVPATLLQSPAFQSISPGYGSCSVVASTGLSVFSNSIKSDPDWVNGRSIVLKHGVAACWAQPIIVQNNLLGAVVAYIGKETEATYNDRTILELTASIAGLSLRMSGIVGSIDSFQKDAAFMRVDGDFRVAATNQEACRILDRSAKEIVGQVLWDFYPNADPLVRAEYKKALNDQIIVCFEFLCAVLGFRLTIIARPLGEGLEILFRAAAPEHSEELA